MRLSAKSLVEFEVADAEAFSGILFEQPALTPSKMYKAKVSTCIDSGFMGDLLGIQHRFKDDINRLLICNWP